MRCDKLASALQHHNALRGETAKSCDSGLSTKVGAKLSRGTISDIVYLEACETGLQRK